MRGMQGWFNIRKSNSGQLPWVLIWLRFEKIQQNKSQVHGGLNT